MTQQGNFVPRVYAPVVTPFKRDYSVDSARFIAFCKWLVSQRAGLAIFGTNSEANSPTFQERVDLLHEGIEAKIDPRGVVE